MRGTKYGLLETHTECKKGNQWEWRGTHIIDQRKQFPPKESSMI